MRRWRVDSIAMTVALTIVTAMGLGFALQHLVSAGLAYIGFMPRQDPQDNRIRFYAIRFPAQVSSLVEVLDAISDGERPAVVAAAQHPQIRVELRGAPLAHLVDSPDPYARLLRRRIEVLLVAPRVIIVASRTQRRNVGAGVQQAGMAVEAPLGDGHWVLFTTNVKTPPPIGPTAIEYSRALSGGWLALSALLVLALSCLTARRLAHPLSELAGAVEQLGMSGDAPLLPLRGPRELQVTIAAFNRMQERLRRFNDDRVQMLAAMSHDLRTSLTRLKLRLEIGEKPEQRQKMIGEIDAMSDMLGSILSFARDDAKREPRTRLDLDALAEGVCGDAADAGAAVTYSGVAGVTVTGRPAALRRAIANLVDNAVKYGGGAEVRLTAETGRIVVTVEDHGPGIPRSERDKVFEPFYRVEGSRNPDTGGVGLGLAVARSIAREHSGDITLAARNGGGLTARLVLPA
jgi:signal transduction histidine kinase